MGRKQPAPARDRRARAQAKSAPPKAHPKSRAETHVSATPMSQRLQGFAKTADRYASRRPASHAVGRNGVNRRRLRRIAPRGLGTYATPKEPVRPSLRDVHPLGGASLPPPPPRASPELPLARFTRTETGKPARTARRHRVSTTEDRFHAGRTEVRPTAPTSMGFVASSPFRRLLAEAGEPACRRQT